MSQPVDTDRNLLVKTPFANVVGWLVMEVELDEPEPYFHATSNKLALVFVGKGKRLSILVPTYWRGGDRAAMLVLLGSQLEERGIEVRRTQSLRNSTFRTEWSAALCRINLALERVGAMFWTRLGALIPAQIVSAVATASASSRRA